MVVGGGAMSKRAREDEEDEAPAVVEAPAPAASASSDPKQDKQERQAREARMALAALPDQEMYEKSYMHRDVVTHLVVAATDFIVTASRDGQLKFWKKQQTGIDFVKHFRAHLAPIAGLSVSFDGTLLATSAADKGLKIFDVQSFDMIHWIKLGYTPGPCEWIGGSSSSRSLVSVRVRVRVRVSCEPNQLRSLILTLTLTSSRAPTRRVR